MSNNKRLRRFLFIGAGIIIIALAIGWIFGRRSRPFSDLPFRETFDAPGEWNIGESASSEGRIVDGQYRMSLEISGDSFWTTAGQNFNDGRFEVEAQPVEGTVDNGYGLLLRVDVEKERFYFLKVSSDGYVYIGLCQDSCAEITALVGDDWFPSPAVRQGLGVSNRLRVDAKEAELTFYVNGEMVGQARDESLQQGDIGLLAETYAPGGLTVAFDNFTVQSFDGD